MVKVATISEANASLYIYICTVIGARMVGKLDPTKKKDIFKIYYAFKKEEQKAFMYKHGDYIPGVVTMKRI